MIQNGCFKICFPKWVSIIIHIIISPGIVLFDEIYLAAKMYPHIRALSKTRISENNLVGQIVNGSMPIQLPIKPATFDDLSETHQLLYKQYYNSIFLLLIPLRVVVYVVYTLKYFFQYLARSNCLIIQITNTDSGRLIRIANPFG